MANLLIQRNITQLVDAVEQQVGDATNTYLTADEAKEAVRKAIYDLSRHSPLQKVYEYTLDFDVADEHFTAILGTAVALAYKPLTQGSETVEETDDTGSFTRDTDYTMDYSNGTITALSTGSMTAKAYHITYTKSKIAVDLSAITDLIRVAYVELPLGSVPQDIKVFSVWGDVLFIGSSRKSSQEKMGDTEHLVLYYEAEHQIADA